MAAVQRFRTQFRGFNREDVVNYIEFLNQQHNSQLEQLNTQLQNIQTPDNTQLIVDLQARLNAAQARCEQLEKQLAEQQTTSADMELAAYRRAERAERLARERAQQIYDQANGALADAAAKVDDASQQVSQMTDRVMAQLAELQDAVVGSKQALRDAAATMYSIRPYGEVK